MSETTPLDPDRLLEHVAWVRRLAGRLCYDDARADDVAQETLLAALRTGPRDAVRPRPWLAAVARSVVRRIRRTTERRDARERVAARPEALPATDEIVVRASLLRAVVDAVLALPEPYRTTILLRFFEELPPRRIAERQGEPVETVRTRSKRGLAMLREKLAAELDVEADDGRRIRGLPALALLLEPVRAVTTIAAATSVGGAVMGGFWMSIAGKLTAIAVVLGVAVASWSLLPERPKSGESAVAASHATKPGAAATSTPQAVASAERSRDAAAPVENPPTSAASDAPAPQDPERWSDVTVETWQNLIRNDEGAAMRAAVAGLEAENLDLVALLRFFDYSFADSIAVPGSGETKSDPSKTVVSWVQVYVNDQGQRSAALPTWSRDAKKDETVGMILPATFWATDRSARLGLDAENLSPWFRIYLQRSESGRRTGSITLDPGPRGVTVDLNLLIAKVKQLEQAGRLPSTLSFDFDDRGGRRTWMRSGSAQELTALECERLNALFDRLAGTGKGFAGLK
jgi:RNA polymerase sigma-70 factor (ECF subfamily)